MAVIGGCLALGGSFVGIVASCLIPWKRDIKVPRIWELIGETPVITSVILSLLTPLFTPRQCSLEPLSHWVVVFHCFVSMLVVIPTTISGW